MKQRYIHSCLIITRFNRWISKLLNKIEKKKETGKKVLGGGQEQRGDGSSVFEPLVRGGGGGEVGEEGRRGWGEKSFNF